MNAVLEGPIYTHTNPSRPLSNGREASFGVELYFVLKALALQIRISEKYKQSGMLLNYLDNPSTTNIIKRPNSYDLFGHNY